MASKPDGGLKDALDLDQARAALAEKPAADHEAAALDLFAGESVFGRIRRPGGETVRSGPGRPRGSLNRSTRDLVKLIESTGKNPIMAMAEIVATPIDVIAATLGCKKIEAAEYHRKVMSDLAPYVAQKLPTAVQVQGANAGMLVINTGAPLTHEALKAFAMQILDGSWPAIEHEENQALSEDEAAPSYDAPSYGEDK
jgi:hypothetical protein